MSLLPAQLYRAAQVRELDRRAIEQYGIPGFTLMQRAAAAALRELRWRWPQAQRLVVVCGPGNNGVMACCWRHRPRRRGSTCACCWPAMRTH
jgi:NAD(P)H-hydrate epimerase